MGSGSHAPVSVSLHQLVVRKMMLLMPSVGIARGVSSVELVTVICRSVQGLAPALHAAALASTAPMVSSIGIIPTKSFGYATIGTERCGQWKMLPESVR